MIDIRLIGRNATLSNTNTLTYTHTGKGRKLQLHRTDDERNKTKKSQTIHLFNKYIYIAIEQSKYDQIVY